MKLFALLLLAIVFAFGQDTQVRGKQVVDEAIAALGGDKFLNVENRVETGRAFSFYQTRLSGLSVARFETRYVPVDPSKSGTVIAQQEYQAYGKKEDFFVLFRDEGAWEVTYRGPKELDQEQIDRHRDSTLHNIFYILRARLKEPGLVFESRGSDVVDNIPVNVVDVTDSTNRVVTVYFHPTTKLPVKQSWVWRDAKTHERNEEVTRFARYREVGGTQWPYQINRERNGDKIYEMFADSVKINQKLNDAKFAVPTPTAKPFKK
jgi:hypothetical protein